jgi:cytochrome P450
MQTLFSKDAWNDIPHIWNPILKTIQYVSPGAWILWRKIPRIGYGKSLKTIDDYLYKIIDERRQTMDDGQPSDAHHHHDLLQHLIDAGLDNNVIRDQMLTMLIAGHDTSTALLAWTFALIGQHPEVHGQVVQEVDQPEGKYQLLDNVIKESLRLYPPIHIGNRRVAENVEFAEGTVPAGERMFYSIYLTHRDPAIWENAEDFCPERFSHGRKTPPMSYIPFGGGPRSCIGAAFGQAEARIVIARLLQRFTFEPLNADNIHPYMGATLEPHPGVMMKVSKRGLDTPSATRPPLETKNSQIK